MGLAQQAFRVLRQLGQTAAPDGFHNHHRDIPLRQNLVLPLCRAVIPVKVVQLDLDEVPFISVRKPGKHFRGSMGGKTEIGDFSLPLHLLEERNAAVMQIIFNIAVPQGVNEVKINIIELKTL